jgi:hypothetical protein
MEGNLLRTYCQRRRLIGGIFLLLLSGGTVLASEGTGHNLLEARINKLSPRKTGAFRGDGVFFRSEGSGRKRLIAARRSYSEQNAHERIVFDFEGPIPPRIYGHISTIDQKLFIDMFHTSLIQPVASLGSSYFVKNLMFYPVDDESLSLEVEFKSPVQLDIFYLESPGRLVVDIKSN